MHPGQENISFDQEGKMLRKEDRNGRGISFFYCEDGKLKKAETDNGSSLTYCYNQRGQLEEVKDWLGTTKIAMDEAGRIASVTDPYGKPWDMNGEAWARERQFFIQMEKRPYMNTMKPCRYRP